ncbi:hypothetical protein BJ085DRAFT_32416 [Dimargaris cristalligena]|uniref:Uncharacterized protein n=1 Tax=Dimargaris cristalligena TaxID=215637 RepID=A0A4P9ZMT1_9FUNG|nr:hypothetical protein BJ085DRAFT_32416 [Dimargaris cristalligena]|eukprot:RKP34445.1 hypothetical protein BJ085DRAFT_32416 [Dimargaris cristalligena]
MSELPTTRRLKSIRRRDRVRWAQITDAEVDTTLSRGGPPEEAELVRHAGQEEAVLPRAIALANAGASMTKQLPGKFGSPLLSAKNSGKSAELNQPPALASSLLSASSIDHHSTGTGGSSSLPPHPLPLSSMPTPIFVADSDGGSSSGDRPNLLTDTPRSRRTVMRRSELEQQQQHMAQSRSLSFYNPIATSSSAISPVAAVGDLSANARRPKIPSALQRHRSHRANSIVGGGAAPVSPSALMRPTSMYSDWGSASYTEPPWSPRFGSALGEASPSANPATATAVFGYPDQRCPSPDSSRSLRSVHSSATTPVHHFRQRVETMRRQAGSTWLKVFCEMQNNPQRSEPESEDNQPQSGDIHDLPESRVALPAAAATTSVGSLTNTAIGNGGDSVAWDSPRPPDFLFPTIPKPKAKPKRKLVPLIPPADTRRAKSPEPNGRGEGPTLSNSAKASHTTGHSTEPGGHPPVPDAASMIKDGSVPSASSTFPEKPALMYPSNAEITTATLCHFEYQGAANQHRFILHKDGPLAPVRRIWAFTPPLSPENGQGVDSPSLTTGHSNRKTPTQHKGDGLPNFHTSSTNARAGDPMPDSELWEILLPPNLDVPSGTEPQSGTNTKNNAPDIPQVHSRYLLNHLIHFTVQLVADSPSDTTTSSPLATDQSKAAVIVRSLILDFKASPYDSPQRIQLTWDASSYPPNSPPGMRGVSQTAVGPLIGTLASHYSSDGAEPENEPGVGYEYSGPTVVAIDGGDSPSATTTTAAAADGVFPRIAAPFTNLSQATFQAVSGLPNLAKTTLGAMLDPFGSAKGTLDARGRLLGATTQSVPSSPMKPKMRSLHQGDGSLDGLPPSLLGFQRSRLTNRSVSLNDNREDNTDDQPSSSPMTKSQWGAKDNKPFSHTNRQYSPATPIPYLEATIIPPMLADTMTSLSVSSPTSLPFQSITNFIRLYLQLEVFQEPEEKLILWIPTSFIPQAYPYYTPEISPETATTTAMAPKVSTGNQGSSRWNLLTSWAYSPLGGTHPMNPSMGTEPTSNSAPQPSAPPRSNQPWPTGLSQTCPTERPIFMVLSNYRIYMLTFNPGFYNTCHDLLRNGNTTTSETPSKSDPLHLLKQFWTQVDRQPSQYLRVLYAIDFDTVQRIDVGPNRQYLTFHFHLTTEEEGKTAAENGLKKSGHSSSSAPPTTATNTGSSIPTGQSWSGSAEAADGVLPASLLAAPPPPTAIPPASLTVLLRDRLICSDFLNSFVIQCYESEVHIVDRKVRVVNHDIEWAVHNLRGTVFLKPGMCSPSLAAGFPVVRGDNHHASGGGSDDHDMRLSRSDRVRLSRGLQSARAKHWIDPASGDCVIVDKVTFEFLKMYYLVGWAAPVDPSSPGHLGPLDSATNPHRPSTTTATTTPFRTTTFIATPSFIYLCDERHDIWPPAIPNLLTLYADMTNPSKPVVADVDDIKPVVVGQGNTRRPINGNAAGGAGHGQAQAAVAPRPSAIPTPTPQTMGAPKTKSKPTPSSSTSQLVVHRIPQYRPFHHVLPLQAIRRVYSGVCLLAPGVAALDPTANLKKHPTESIGGSTEPSLPPASEVSSTPATPNMATDDRQGHLPEPVTQSSPSHSNPPKSGDTEAWIHSQGGAGLYNPTQSMPDRAGVTAMGWTYWVTLEFEPDATAQDRKRTESKTASASISTSASAEPLLPPWQLFFTTTASATEFVESLRHLNLRNDVSFETF